MNDEEMGLITGKRGPSKGSTHECLSHSRLWQEILGPELTEDLIADAWAAIESGSWKVRQKNGS